MSSLRRLHLVIVDTWRQKWLARMPFSCALLRGLRLLARSPGTPRQFDLLRALVDINIKLDLCGYALDGSTFPCYCICPARTEDHSFQLMDSSTGYISTISQTPSIRPLGVAHFYDAFSTCHELDLRDDALRHSNSRRLLLALTCQW